MTGVQTCALPISVAALALTGALYRNAPVGGGPVAGPARIGALSVPAARLAGSVVTVVATGPGGRRFASGVCIEHDGAIATTARAVAGATQVDVITADGGIRAARVEARDLRHDLAFLALSGSDGTRPAAAGLADRPSAVGDAVWVVGAGSRAASEPWMSTEIGRAHV